MTAKSVVIEDPTSDGPGVGDPLLALAAEYRRLIRLHETAAVAQDDSYDLWRATMPKMPETLRIAPRGGYLKKARAGRACSDAKPVAPFEMNGETRAASDPGRAYIGFMERGDKVLEAWNSYQAAVEAARLAAGVTAAEERCSATYEAVFALEGKIMAAPAVTLAQFAIKALVVSRNTGMTVAEDGYEAAITLQLLAELRAAA